MLYLTSETKILLAIQPVDFRRQIDGLVALCEQQLKHNPRSGALFAFINRSRSMIRILCYQDGGYWLATKRLSKGCYSHWPSSKHGVVSKHHASELTKILRTCLVSK